nr:uncharacterized protein LOC129529335 [Gorilla gorilla gorilla]
MHPCHMPHCTTSPAPRCHMDLESRETGLRSQPSRVGTEFESQLDYLLGSKARASCARPSPGPAPPAASGRERIAEPRAARRASAGNQGDAPGTADNLSAFQEQPTRDLSCHLGSPTQWRWL